MKTFHIGYHACNKIRQREIDREDIPDLEKLTVGLHKIVKKVGKRELVAFYEIRPTTVFLMTAYWRDK